MFTSAADVFRTRQVMSDLTACIAHSGRSAFCRITPRHSRLNGLVTGVADRGGVFRYPRDRDIYGEVLLAAALPDDDFPAFTAATAILLLDHIHQGGGQDDLYWNWDAFSDHYRLADPPVRAVIMNAYRTAAAIGRVSIARPPEPDDCFTMSRDDILRRLRPGGSEALLRAVEADVSPREAGDLWRRTAPDDLSPVIVAGFRYLYERPQSLLPAAPETTALIPWVI